MPSSVVELIHECAGDEDAVLFVRDVEESLVDSMTYAELDRAARRLAVALLDRLTPGERVLLPITTGLGFAQGFLGCLYAGMVVVPAPPPDDGAHRTARLAGIARDADIAAVIAEAPALPGVWCLSPDTEADPDAWMMPHLDRDSLALLQYTSGSTSEPKGVMVTHGNLLHNVDTVDAAMGRPRPVRFGGWGPLFHDMGLAMLLKPLLLGGTSVLMAPTTFLKRPVRWLRLIDRFDLRFSPAPNFAYDLCVRQVTDDQLADLDLSRWEFAANGSEPVSKATMDAFARRFAPAGLRAEALRAVYGLAEATVYVSGLESRAPTTKAVVSCGTPHGFEVRVVDPETTEPLPDGQVGEIWLRGESVASGYWRRSDPAFTPDGFLRTGDLGMLAGGELFVTGRLKELIIVHGRNLYPQDLERHVAGLAEELSGVVGAAFTVGTPEDRVVIVHEVRGRPGPDRLAELSELITRSVAREFGVTVSGVALVRKGTVLRTTSGKVRRSAMRERWVAGELRTWLAERIASYVDRPVAELDPDEALAALGLSSVYALVLCGEIEDRYGITVDELLFFEHPTINAIVGHLSGALPAGRTAT